MWGVWPLACLAGGFLLSPFMALAGLLAVFARRSKRRPKTFVRLFFLFIGVAVLSTFWSPLEGGGLSGNLWSGDFAIKAPALRVAALSLALLFSLAAALAFNAQQAKPLARIMVLALAVHAVIVILLALFTDQALALAAPLSHPVREAPQNLIRNVNLLALVLPLLLAATVFGRFPTRQTILLTLFGFGLGLFASLKLSAASAALGLVAGGLVFGVVHIWPRNGFRVVFGALSASVLAMPFLVQLAYQITQSLTLTLPLSFQARIWGWQVVHGKINEKLWFGHGIEAASTWRETYSTYPDWLAEAPDRFANISVVAGHPHNMALEIWAETGLVGVGLFAGGLIMLGMAMPWPHRLSLPARFAVCGLIGAASTQFMFAYSVWDDAFWAGLAAAIIGCILIAKRDGS